MFYGILGDSNGDDPQVTGEASWLMARTCFPNDGLAGDKGHGEADVTCKLFHTHQIVLANRHQTSSSWAKSLCCQGTFLTRTTSRTLESSSPWATIS